MVRIVGVQRSTRVLDEFVLLQNQGTLRVSMRGFALVSGVALDGDDGSFSLLTDELDLHPGQYMLVRSCIGPSRWMQPEDGAPIYYHFLGHTRPVWGQEQEAVHLLAPQHTFCERTSEAIVV